MLHVEPDKVRLEQRRVNHVDINGRAQTSNDGGRIACLSSLMSSQMIAIVTGPTFYQQPLAGAGPTSWFVLKPTPHLVSVTGRWGFTTPHDHTHTFTLSTICAL